MKLFQITILLILTILLLNSSLAIASDGHDDDHDHHGDEITNHCDHPEDQLEISTEQFRNSYDDNEYHVEKNTCYQLVFTNLSIDTEHDVNIDAVDTRKVSMDKVHVHVANNTDGPYANGTNTFNILTPDADTELEIYCSVEGHRSDGMEALLIVGEGDKGFLPLSNSSILAGFLAVMIAIPYLRRK